MAAAEGCIHILPQPGKLFAHKNSNSEFIIILFVDGETGVCKQTLRKNGGKNSIIDAAFLNRRKERKGRVKSEKFGVNIY